MSGPVVVGVDGSTPALDAVRWAVGEAGRRGAPLRLVHAELVLPHDLQDPDGRIRAALREQAARWLREAADVARSIDPDVPVEPRVEVAEPASLLLAESEGASAVVVGSRGLGGFTALLLGSTAIALTSRGGCPVVVARGEQRTGPVVVGVHDDHPLLLAHAFEQAAARGAGLVAVHAWHAPPEAFADAMADALGVDVADHDAAHGGKLAGILAPWRDKYPDVRLELVIAHGNPARALLDRARDASLLVVGCHGRGALTGLLFGSTSHALLHHAPCPVLVVREGGGAVATGAPRADAPGRS
ncbi:universal stress protein [Saccharothrix coeruleofusca]|uniref:Universal stress protein n=1 Tax=Saccharothrix coeruleofusca TaxID=33919 RepID=A0A918AR47_9PSEU|nr:universal stress protein [Saccharothrix coeruleofusca]MBP2335695.1 nucleotide-binding universal stress UspA family protein [Saccharothrix coeruleofusca]GGP75713.1 universal stress protein [Saccharothrix coeruleofusca]